MEKAPEQQTIHLMTLIQLKIPHKTVTQTKHNTPRSTYQPTPPNIINYPKTNYPPQWPHQQVQGLMTMILIMKFRLD
jgi:hypothetical protein